MVQPTGLPFHLGVDGRLPDSLALWSASSTVPGSGNKPVLAYRFDTSRFRAAPLRCLMMKSAYLLLEQRSILGDLQPIGPAADPLTDQSVSAR